MEAAFLSHGKLGQDASGCASFASKRGYPLRRKERVDDANAIVELTMVEVLGEHQPTASLLCRR